jgi:hypothetical protein
MKWRGAFFQVSDLATEEYTYKIMEYWKGLRDEEMVVHRQIN